MSGVSRRQWQLTTLRCCDSTDLWLLRLWLAEEVHLLESEGDYA